MIHIFGDSHGIFNFQNLEFVHCNHSTLSITMHRFGRDRLQFLDFTKYGVSNNDIIVYQIGEIDCRCHIGKQILKGRALEEIIETLTENFIQSILENIQQYQQLYIVVCCIPPPTDEEYYELQHGKMPDSFPYPFVGTNKERVEYTKKINQTLKEKCEKHKFHFLDYYHDYCDSNGLLITKLSDNTVHIKDNSKILKMFSDFIITSFYIYKIIISKFYLQTLEKL